MSMLYGELTSPTAVTHAIQAHLRSPEEQNLVIAKSSLLQIFRIETSVRETQIRHTQTARNALADSLAEIMLGEDGGEDFMGDDSQVQLLRHEKLGRLVLVEEEQHGSALVDGALQFFASLHPYQLRAHHQHLRFVAGMMGLLHNHFVLHDVEVLAASPERLSITIEP